MYHRLVAHDWTFLSHHAQVLVCIARDPHARLREIAVDVEITERAVQAIVNDLVESGYLERTRVGRRNRYDVRLDGALRHPLQRGIEVRALLDAVTAVGR